MQASRTHWLKWFLGLDIFLAAILAGLYMHENKIQPVEALTAIRQLWSETNQTIGATSDRLPAEVRPIDVPLLLQKPELPRGCEVTSLAMLLQNAGVKVSKMKLASEIKKVPYAARGKYGDPEKGFVGDMYDSDQPGYGVYHKPIAHLAGRYLPDRVADLSGQSFASIERKLSEGKPVLVITNITFRPLSDSAFQTWQTKSGPIRVTYYEHAVLLTGYNRHSVFFNNPLGKKNTSADKTNFIKAWKQMGSQAISYNDFPGL